MNKWRHIKWSVHPLFVIILFFSVITGYFLELIVLFSIVVLHEVGHIFMSHAVGWKVRSVKLLPFGGVIEVDDSNGIRARDEIMVALAGPMQNGWMIIIAILCEKLQWWSYDWIVYFISANMWIACFNLIPILPLDGGKIVQAVMSYNLSYYKAILWSARLSIVGSILLIGYAITPLFVHSYNIKLNEAMIGAFLLFSNIMTIRHLPFIMYRFILSRTKHFERLERYNKQPHPIVITAQTSVYQTLKGLHRERLNLICVTERNKNKFEMISEKKLLKYSTERFDVHRAVSDIIQ